MQKRLVFTALLFLPFLFSCKKFIQDKQQDLVLAAMTNGRWYVSEYLAGSTNVTSEFDGYEFQFHSNGTVEGIKGSTTKSGTWSGDATNYTITSNFPGASLPLSRLNGTWKWTDSDFTYVYSYYNDGTQTNYLKLRKK
jgi:hypothetical protein